MAELPTMPVRTDALLGDTTDMSATEFGAYVRILLAMWRNGGWLPNDEKRLARYGTLTAGQWARSGHRIMECLVDMGDGKVTQGKLAEEYAGALAVSKAASENANSRWRKHRRNEPRISQVEKEQWVKAKAVGQQPDLPSDSPHNSNALKSLKYNDTADAGAVPPQCYPDPVSIKEEEEEDARETPDLYTRVLIAVGLNPRDILPTYWLPPGAIVHVESWRNIGPAGLTDDDIEAVARGSRNGRAPPNGPLALDRAMARFAGQKAAAPLQPIAPPEGGTTHGRRASPADPDRTQRVIDGAVARFRAGRT